MQATEQPEQPNEEAPIEPETRYMRPEEETKYVKLLTVGDELTENDVRMLKHGLLHKVTQNNVIRDNNIEDLRHDLDQWFSYVKDQFDIIHTYPELQRIAATYPELQRTIRTMAANYETLIDILQVRASTVDLPTPLPKTVEQELKEMKATIQELQAKLGMPQDSTQETPASATTQDALRFH